MLRTINEVIRSTVGDDVKCDSDAFAAAVNALALNHGLTLLQCGDGEAGASGSAAELKRLDASWNKGSPNYYSFVYQMKKTKQSSLLQSLGLAVAS
jgi:hypothetical protein